MLSSYISKVPIFVGTQCVCFMSHGPHPVAFLMCLEKGENTRFLWEV